mmetsp:Transcript_43078/g.80752  ORF Transcript_43078/g.80752 Transcript_43078/m.80752 type:complete len:209 (-) Transcript_43078:614-1240(-)
MMLRHARVDARFRGSLRLSSSRIPEPKFFILFLGPRGAFFSNATSTSCACISVRRGSGAALLTKGSFEGGAPPHTASPARVSRRARAMSPARALRDGASPSLPRRPARATFQPAPAPADLGRESSSSSRLVAPRASAFIHLRSSSPACALAIGLCWRSRAPKTPRSASAALMRTLSGVLLAREALCVCETSRPVSANSRVVGSPKDAS